MNIARMQPDLQFDVAETVPSHSKNNSEQKNLKMVIKVLTAA